MKRPWHSSVIWFNGLGLGMILLSPEVHNLVCSDKYFAAAVLVINLALRFKTNEPIQIKK